MWGLGLVCLLKKKPLCTFCTFLFFLARLWKFAKKEKKEKNTVMATEFVAIFSFSQSAKKRSLQSSRKRHLDCLTDTQTQRE
jgi:hypothetical protein